MLARAEGGVRYDGGSPKDTQRTQKGNGEEIDDNKKEVAKRSCNEEGQKRFMGGSRAEQKKKERKKKKKRGKKKRSITKNVTHRLTENGLD